MKFIKKEMVKRSMLIRNWALYPRHDIDRVHVNDLVEAYGAGTEIPPICVDIKTKWIIDGFHRDNMFEKLKIDEIEVNFYEFDDEKDMLKSAISWNAKHGLGLTQHDRTRCINIGRAKGLTEEDISKALFISIERIKKIEVQRIRHIGINRIPVEVKPVLSAITKDMVTQEQFEAQKPFNAMRADYSIERSIDALRGNLLPVDEKNIQRVRKLEIACKDWLAAFDLSEAGNQ